MKHINLLSFVQAQGDLNPELFKKLMNNHRLDITSNKKIKPQEIEGIKNLTYMILKTNNNISILNNYFLNYTIPQIGKEFDLLRIGDNYIVNIEIKSESTNYKIIKQQERNRYYLSFLNKEIHIYTYITKENKLYKFISNNSTNSIQEIQFTELCMALVSQNILQINNINDLFNPSNYLISPFNSTEKFMNEKYFLTELQEAIYNDILNEISGQNITFFSVTGGAGTGKTLLIYHITKIAINNKLKILILHCGRLNEGHNYLKEKHHWNIEMTTNCPDLQQYDIIIIDEAQRITESQFNEIKNLIFILNKKCIFSYDSEQYLRKKEKNIKLDVKLSLLTNHKSYRLTNQIRTNKEIHYFIEMLFNIKRNIPDVKFNNIEIMYYNDNDSAKQQLQFLKNLGWKTPNYTPGILSTFEYEEYSTAEKDNAHTVIGQEYDYVAIAIDKHFKYNELTGRLEASNFYYSQSQMLYQILTRARKKLFLVIINNNIILNRCLEIINKTQ